MNMQKNIHFLSRSPAGKFFPSSRNQPGRPASLYMDTERGRPGTLEFPPIPFCVPGSKIFPGVPAPQGAGTHKRISRNFSKVPRGRLAFFCQRSMLEDISPPVPAPPGRGTGAGETGRGARRGDWEDLE